MRMRREERCMCVSALYALEVRRAALCLAALWIAVSLQAGMSTRCAHCRFVHVMYFPLKTGANEKAEHSLRARGPLDEYE